MEPGEATLHDKIGSELLPCGTKREMTVGGSMTITDTRSRAHRGEANVEVGHIKSRERKRDLGEVYTQAREVDAMLALIPDAFRSIDTRFLEPAAGNGNFLVAILVRKIALLDEAIHGGTDNWYEFALLRCLASTYGVDINEENVLEARERIRAVIDAAHVFNGGPVTAGFSAAAAAILHTNVVVGDSLHGADAIVFVAYTPLDGERFARKASYLEDPKMDLFYEPPAPMRTVHYSELGSD